MRTYEKILKPEFADRLLAHTSDAKEKEPEKLVQHSEKTLLYFKKICSEIGLTKIFEKIVLEILPKEFMPIFLELIESIIYYHDLGKINPLFQKMKMKNNLDINGLELTSQHSFYGKILFDAVFSNYFYRKICSLDSDTKDKNNAFYLFFLFSQPIDRHHSSLLDIDSLAEKISNEEIKKKLESLSYVAGQILKEWKKIDFSSLSEYYEFKHDYKNKLNRFSPEKKEALFYLYKLIYSLLITSDYYATMDYMQGISYLDHIKYITTDIKVKIIKEFYKEKTLNNKKYHYNSKLLDEKESKLLLNKDIEKIDELNDLRNRILLEADETLKKAINESPGKKIFYLKVPTGGGKTNISLKLILTLLDKKDIKKVFYVFPFINIIEQNYQVIKDTLGLDKEISPVYSTSSWNLNSTEKDEQLRYVLDNEFLNFPFVVMSNVNFFNTFIKSGKSSNYRLLNLANSIVVLDEIQSLNDKDWTVFNDFITFGSKYLNIYFIIMSATLPNLDKISLDLEEILPNIPSKKIVNLIENHNSYFKHQKFHNRVKFEFREEVQDLDQILGLLEEEINKNQPKKILIVLNTIEDSRDIYRDVNNKYFTSKGYSICLLNSTILPFRRKKIICKIKKEDEKVILVSTQSVEAGVDIDCDFGIRDFAIFDSIEQVGGRVNRNFNNKESAKLIITNLKKDNTQKASYIYERTHRWNTIRKHYSSSDEIRKFLENREFEQFYNSVIDFIKLRNNDKIRENSLDMVKNGVRGLNFPKLNRMKVIDQNSISLFVNVDITKKDFTKEEIKFIKEKCVIVKNKISGKKVWGLYKKFNKDFGKGIVDRNIETKIWSSILSKFTISVLDYYIDGENLSKKLNISDSFVFLKEGYSIEEGINPKAIRPEWIESFEDFLV